MIKPMRATRETFNVQLDGRTVAVIERLTNKPGALFPFKGYLVAGNGRRRYLVESYERDDVLIAIYHALTNKGR